MRKILLSVSSLLFTVAVAAQTEINKDTLSGNWAVLSGGPGMDMVGQISTNDENEIFFTQDFYSSETIYGQLIMEKNLMVILLNRLYK